ncbi:MFS transporter [Kineosporia mesophila]|nr:MFS transporter [Kineosporia mesophila]MCD5350608.1 MFS transporter [Kineosporia mesophila]
MSVNQVQWPALAAVAAAALLAVLDGTVVAVALNSLAGSFEVRLDQVVWVTIGYLLAVAAVLPVLGYLTARFGARVVFVAGLLIFLAGSGLTALAGSVPALIGFRVIQGVGGGLIEPTAMTLAAGLAPTRQLGRVMGVMSMIINVAPVLGPLVGGLLLQTGHWQWIFLVNLPLGALVLMAVLSATRESGATRESSAVAQASVPKADGPGLLLLTVGFVGLLFALNRSGEGGVSPPVVLAGVLGALLLAAYVPYAARMSREGRPPALDLRLLARPGFGAGMGVMGLVGLVMFAQLTALPLFAAQHFGLIGLEQGVLVSALGLGLLVSMSAGGRLSDNVGARPLVMGGAAVTFTAVLVFVATHDDWPLGALYALFVFVGLGFGATAAPTVAGAFRLLRPGEQAAGSTALFMTVQFGASVGVTLLGLLQAVTQNWVTWLFLVIAGVQVIVFGLGSQLLTRGQLPHFSSP